MSKLPKNHLSAAQKVIIGVIIIAITVTIVATISIIATNPENSIKTKIESLSADYYENYLYQSILDSSNFSGDIETTLEKYVDSGFSAITLRDLLLHDSKKTADIAPVIKKYCNENQTTIKFYPEPPFSRNSYRTEYKYSCEF